MRRKALLVVILRDLSKEEREEGKGVKEELVIRFRLS